YRRKDGDSSLCESLERAVGNLAVMRVTRQERKPVPMPIDYRAATGLVGACLRSCRYLHRGPGCQTPRSARRGKRRSDPGSSSQIGNRPSEFALARLWPPQLEIRPRMSSTFIL